MSGRWSLPDQTGRRVVVTGASSGIGLATARGLADAGAHVVLAVRDVAKGAATGVPGEVRQLDLADLDSVRAFAAGWTGDLDVLVNNAGIMNVPFGLTPDGFELQLGTNHLGHFALTNLLLPHVTDRVVTVSSFLHRTGAIALHDLNWTARLYDPRQAYAQSKLANLLFTLELQRRLEAAGSAVRAVAAHPGWAATALQHRTGSRFQDALGSLTDLLFAQSAERGALPTLYAATADVPGGSYAGPDGRFGLHGDPTLVGRSAGAQDADLARRLWAASTELTGTDVSL